MFKFVEPEDWYEDPETGLVVWTRRFLVARGFCCNGGCRHCPYDENGDVVPEVPIVIRYEEKRSNS